MHMHGGINHVAYTYSGKPEPRAPTPLLLIPPPPKRLSRSHGLPPTHPRKLNLFPYAKYDAIIGAIHRLCCE